DLCPASMGVPQAECAKRDQGLPGVVSVHSEKSRCYAGSCRCDVGKRVSHGAIVPSLFVTVTATGPADPRGVVAVALEELTTCTFGDTLLPKVTVAPTSNPTPVMETAVPPAVVLWAGVMLVTWSEDLDLPLP